MVSFFRALAFAAPLALGACGLVTPQPADPRVVLEIVRACTYSGFFKMADGALVAAVPAVSLPVSLVNAGVDRVCEAPEKFASDISTVEWVVKNTLQPRRS